MKGGLVDYKMKRVVVAVWIMMVMCKRSIFLGTFRCIGISNTR